MTAQAVALGIGAPAPTGTAPRLGPRGGSRPIRGGSVPVGDDVPISARSVTATPTADIRAILRPSAESTAAATAAADRWIVRVAVIRIVAEAQIVETLVAGALRPHEAKTKNEAKNENRT
jgi:hypothetical protein